MWTDQRQGNPLVDRRQCIAAINHWRLAKAQLLRAERDGSDPARVLDCCDEVIERRIVATRALRAVGVAMPPGRECQTVRDRLLLTWSISAEVGPLARADHH